MIEQYRALRASACCRAINIVPDRCPLWKWICDPVCRLSRRFCLQNKAIGGASCRLVYMEFVGCDRLPINITGRNFALCSPHPTPPLPPPPDQRRSDAVESLHRTCWSDNVIGLCETDRYPTSSERLLRAHFHRTVPVCVYCVCIVFVTLFFYSIVLYSVMRVFTKQ